LLSPGDGADDILHRFPVASELEQSGDDLETVEVFVVLPAQGIGILPDLDESSASFRISLMSRNVATAPITASPSRRGMRLTKKIAPFEIHSSS